jgi:hypothetical protein
MRKDARALGQEEKAEKADMNCRLCMYSQFIFNEMEHQRCTAPLTSYFYERAQQREYRTLKTGHCRSLRSRKAEKAVPHVVWKVICAI